MSSLQEIRENELFELQMFETKKNGDILFTKLLAFQWVLAIIIASILSPFSWNGTVSSIHPHLYAAIFLGGAATFYPIYRFRTSPGARENGYFACAGQMLYSMLLIHITGGRIGSHFHIFGSLAFLSFYRNSKIILLATLMTTLDHFGRGAFMPESLYGVSNASNWRALEHAAWVIFEDVFLLIATATKIRSMRLMAHREFALEDAIANTEIKVQERTKDLLEAQQNLINAERLSSLGEMAAGIAHEINNPLAIIGSISKLIRIKSQRNVLSPEDLEKSLNEIDLTVDRASKIIVGLRNISRDTSGEGMKEETLDHVFSDVLSICRERFKNNSICLELVDCPLLQAPLLLQRVQISQVFLNLLSNSFDAIKDMDGDKWIRISCEADQKTIRVIFSDSGPGIPHQIRNKIFQPFFTTKEVGKGTGLGLSLSRSILEKHGGHIKIEENQPNTSFTVILPMKAA